MVIGLLAALALAGFLAIALPAANPPVRARLLAYRVLDAGHVAVRLQVRKPPEATAVCRVRARNRAGVEVGLAEVPVAPRGDGKRTTKLDTTLATRDRAILAELRGCRLNDR